MFLHASLDTVRAGGRDREGRRFLDELQSGRRDVPLRLSREVHGLGHIVSEGTGGRKSGRLADEQAHLLLRREGGQDSCSRITPKENREDNKPRGNVKHALNTCGYKNSPPIILVL